ncbi:MAG: nuclear transport factor 2 family protein, partial [Xanthobacteraceae bacterium]
MRRFVIAAVAIAVLAAGTLVIGRTAPVDDEQAASKAHAAFVASLRKGDQKAIGAVLDRRFIWTDAEGRTFTRREALKALSALATANPDTDVHTRFYGRMLMVRGEHDQTRFLRVFVKRRHGWKAFA